MRLAVVTQDVWQIVAAVDHRGACPFIESLRTVSQSDAESYAQISLRLRRLARNGPVRDERKSRKLADGIFELKTPRGWRILYFFRPGRVIVCSEIRRKPKQRELAALVRRAELLRDACEAAAAAGDLRIARGD